jgi:hypothetical protein
MKIVNAALLKQFRTPGYCEICNFYVIKREPHHLRRTGMGGNGRLDVRVNLIALGGNLKLPDGRERFLCRCHRLIHDGKIPAERVLSIVALREKCNPVEIEEVLHWMRRLVKPTKSQIEAALRELSEGALAIALRELESEKC